MIKSTTTQQQQEHPYILFNNLSSYFRINKTIISNLVKVQILLQLQRGWNTRSCGNVNRMCKINVATSTSANMAATLSHPMRVGNITPTPDNLESNTSTLPYIRNIYKNSTLTSNMPKSISTWGPLHKPLHWKVRSLF